MMRSLSFRTGFYSEESFLNLRARLDLRVFLAAFLLIPGGIVALYTLPALGVIVGIGDPLADDLLVTSLVAVCTFLVFCFIAVAPLQGYRADLSRPRAVLAAKVVVISLFASYAILVIDFGGLPLTRYLLEGGGPSLLRAEFSKDKTGIASAALYLRSSVMKSIFPLSLLILLGSGNRRWFSTTLLIFSFLAISTFEKAIIMWVGAPMLICFFLLRQASRGRMTLLWVVLVFGAASSIQIVAGDRELLQASSANRIDYAEWNGARGVRPWEIAEKPVLLADLQDISNYQTYLVPEAGSTGVFSRIGLSIANRAFWIPFVTAYDALVFWQVRFHSELLYTGTNRHLAAMTGADFVDLERELFRFQFGSGQDSLGNANFVYFVEAFMAFGIAGVVGFSALLGLCCGFFAASQNTAIISSVFAVGMSVLNASLISSFFSGGLALLVLFVIFIPTWRKA